MKTLFKLETDYYFDSVLLYIMYVLCVVYNVVYECVFLDSIYTLNTIHNVYLTNVCILCNIELPHTI